MPDVNPSLKFSTLSNIAHAYELRLAALPATSRYPYPLEEHHLRSFVLSPWPHACVAAVVIAEFENAIFELCCWGYGTAYGEHGKHCTEITPVATRHLATAVVGNLVFLLAEASILDLTGLVVRRLEAVLASLSIDFIGVHVRKLLGGGNVIHLLEIALGKDEINLFQ
ncbi:hypothetical protein KCU99_g374, partial [Aureobasidium melanogenum]